jgi:hypothetical protein
VHHRQAPLEEAHPRETATFEDASAALGFQKSQAQQHHHMRAEIDRVLDELLGQLVGRVRDDALAPGGQLLHEEVAPVEVRGISVVDEIAADHLVAGCTQDVDDGTATAGGLPQSKGQAFDAQQRLDCAGGRLVEIIAAVGERVPTVQTLTRCLRAARREI